MMWLDAAAGHSNEPMPKPRVFYALIENYDDRWTLVFPDLPGVTIVGDTREQVLASGDIALHSALAADPNLYPSSYFDISQRAAVTVAIRLGKELVTMPV